jgi:hypothetical protein
VDPKAGLGDVEYRKFLTPPGIELRPLGHPISSQSLYRLSYLGSSYIYFIDINSFKDVFRALTLLFSYKDILVRLNISPLHSGEYSGKN